MDRRIIIHNPFFDAWYGINLYKFLTRRVSHLKDSYLGDYLIRTKNKNIIIYVELNQNSFFGNRLLIRLGIMPLITLTEFFFWCLINRINIFSLNIIFNKNNIRPNDVLLSNSYCNLDLKYRYEDLESIDAITAFILQHSFADTDIISDNSKKLGVDLFIAENNLKKNSAYIKNYFNWYKKDVYHLPYVYKPRFKNLKLFNQRKNICFATGTYENLKDHPRYKGLKDFFEIETIHPMRKIIYENANDMKDIIYSKISDYNEVELKSVNGGVIIKIYNRLYNTFFVKQTNYFKFDIVAEYNNAKMFIVPEEANNLPGIGFVEGMACGSAYIGLDDPMYKDIGLLPEVHYISYDGTLSDLKIKIRYYQDNNAELEKIAKRGYEFAKENFNGEHVAQKLYNDLMKSEISSSFVINNKKDNVLKDIAK